MRSGKAFALLALRVSVGWLMLVWGVDKLVNPSHGVAVADRFYLGLFGTASLMPVLAVITGVTLLGVWRSVIDPWGWALDGSNALFFPSLIIFAGVLVLIAFRDEDVFAAGARPAPAT